LAGAGGKLERNGKADFRLPQEDVERGRTKLQTGDGFKAGEKELK
jgi:hypothetical protein